jgi:PAS domain S-box-containing protein
MPHLMDIFHGESSMSSLMRAHDWSQTPLGPPEHWPEALKAPVRLMMMSRFEMWLGWGSNLTFFYNDAYVPTLGSKHPAALGQPMAKVWKEVFDDVKGRIDSVMTGGTATWDEGLQLILERSGYPEETYHTFSYSPIVGEDGTVLGLMCVVREETERVISERRLKLLNELSAALLGAQIRSDVARAVEQIFQGNARDFPFAALRVFDDAADDNTLLIGLGSLADAARSGRKQRVVDLAGVVPDPPMGDWDIPPREALIVAVDGAGQSGAVGALILGLNPYRLLDAATRDFASLIAGQIAGTISAIDATAAERLEITRLRDLFAQSPSFIAVVRGPGHRFEFVNPSYLQLVAHRDVIGQTAREALPEVEGQGFFELLDGVYASGEAYVGQSVPILIHRTADALAEERILDFVYQPIRDEAGLVSGIFVEGIDVTSAHDAVAALRESEAQFRTFAQAVPNQAWTAKPDGSFDWFNERVFEYSGLDQTALEGAGWIQLIHPDDVSATAASWGEALVSGERYETEFRIRRHDGEYRWHLVRAYPNRAADGQISRWVGTNTDIDDHKLSEVETLRDRDRLWALSQDLMLICDFDGIISSVNPSATRMLGWTEEELVGHPLSEFVHPGDVASTAAEVGKLAHGATTLAYENRYRTKDGDYLLIDWTAVPDEGRIHAVGRDITDERRLARDRQRIWELSPIVKVVAKTSGEILAVNPSWTKTLGWSSAETIGRNVLEFVAEQEREPAIIRLARLAAPGAGIIESQSVFCANDDKPHRFAWTTVPEGGMLYLFGRDITAETEAAEALASTEEALRQSQKMEAVGQLTGGIAHDFNNLLAAVLGNLELLGLRIAQGRLEALPRHVEAAQGAANRAAALTQRLLAFSRRQTLDPTPVDVNKLVAGFEDMLRRSVGPSIEIEVVGAGGLWPTLVDRYQLENALLNLCINARDAMPDGGRLTIETANTWLDDRAARERELTPGQYMALSVTDTGTGMPQDVIERAFDPFFTTKPMGEGTGLGLSMIYGFVRQSGGQVRIYSEIGTGTTMRLYLPRHHGEVEDIESSSATSLPTGGHGETVLVIDDEVMIRMLVAELLTDAGYYVIEASDGPSGLKILQSDQRIDLLVTDVGLPGGMNGRQVADACRSLRPELKVLFITGYAENALVGNGMLDHRMQVITKPFAMEIFINKVRDLIDLSDKAAAGGK